MADILAIYPKTGFDIKNVSVEMPLGLLSTVSTVCEDYDVRIIDQRLEENFNDVFQKELAKGPMCVLVPSWTGPQIKHALEVSKTIKENSKAPVIWGGVHPTMMPQQTIENQFIDVIVVGEGEFIFKNIMNALSGKQQMEEVQGIAFKNNMKTIHFTDPASFPDLNLIPELPYHLVNVENYTKAGGVAFTKNERTLPFITSRGCPYTCKFCSTAGMYNGKWRAMNAELVHERVSKMVKKFNIDVVKFYDENFTSNPKRAEHIAEMINSKFKWSMQARMDNMLITDMHKLERNGLCVVEPGIESGSDRILSLVNKGETKATMIAANRKLGTTNIKAFYNFMMGFPDESNEELMETVDLAVQILRDNKNAHISQFYIFTPYLGAPLFDYAVQNGFEVPKKLEDWAGFSRQQRYTPWIQDKKEQLEAIMYMSKFIDGRRLSQALTNTKVPKVVIRHVSNKFRKNWERHEFKKTISIKMLEFMAKKKFNMEVD